MSEKKKSSAVANEIDDKRRRMLAGVVAGLGVVVAGSVQASEEEEELRFPGDPPDHKVVYQFNKADLGYQDHVIFSVGEMIRKYGDNVKVVVVAFAEGIHILAKNPGREVKEEIKQRVSSLSQYGVEFVACGNTMKSLNWTEDDLVPFAKSVQVGAAHLMELQEEGYAYISW